MEERIIIIGDIHGCLEELKELLEKVQYVEGVDKVILVGDLVGKGPCGTEVVRFCRDKGFQSVVCNHDERVLEYRRDLIAGVTPREFRELTHKQCAQTLSEKDWNYLENLPYYIEIPQFNCVVVHAGFVPDVPLQNQKKWNMTHMRNLKEDMTALELISEGVPWASLWNGPLHVIFGHDAPRGLQQYSFATGLDSGCCYGGELTCFLLPTRKIESVKAHQQYAPKQPERLLGK